MFLSKPIKIIKDEDFEFKNSFVRVLFNKECSEIELAGLSIGPFKEGGEYEVVFWIALELEKAGIAQLLEEELDEVTLYKIQWKERVQSVNRFSSLPKNFYPKLRHYIENLKKESLVRTEKMREYEKIIGLSQDIINCRLKKIVSLSSSSPIQANQILKNLTKEEHVVYIHLFDVISEWRSQILEGVD